MQRSAAALFVITLCGRAYGDGAPQTITGPTTNETTVEPSVGPTVEPSSMSTGETITMTSGTSYRNVAEEFLVLPDGLDVGGRLRLIMADGGLGPSAIKLTDLALLDLAAQWALAKHYELDVALSVLPKQPSSTHENVFQGGSIVLRRDVAARTAVALGGAGAPLVGIDGTAYSGSLFLTHKHRLNEIVTFALAGGASSTFLRPAGTMDHPIVIEGAASGSVLARVPNGVWGGWVGASYAIPAYKRGNDPISGMRLDPQPRLDLTLGTAVQLGDRWDLSVELSIIDRGDLANPATRMPLLDGGFDQYQFMLGISRRIDLSKHSDRGGISDPLIQL